MASLKRRPDKDLNHDNWDQEEPPEEMGQFKKATEEQMTSRRILKPRKKIGQGSPGTATATPGTSTASTPSAVLVSNNPFRAFSFGFGDAAVSSIPAPSFNFNINNSPKRTRGGADEVGGDKAMAGPAGSFFKLAGITPSSEPPTKASADSSTAETITSEAVAVESESDGITEESSNSSSLPWNASAKERDKEDSNSNNAHSSLDLNNASWLCSDDKEASPLSSEQQPRAPPREREEGDRQQGQNPNEQVIHPAPSSAMLEQSPASNSDQNGNGAINFGNFGGNGSLFAPFHSLNNQPSSTSQQQQKSPVQTSQASGPVIRETAEADSGENETTSSSNKNLENACNENDGESDVCSEHNIDEEREAEGIDS